MVASQGMDVWDLITLVRNGSREEVRSALASGVAASARCEYTGMSPLLAACEEGRVDVAELLLAHGANPNHTHFDGYNCYDSTHSLEVRALLLGAGFSLAVEQNHEGRGIRGRRVLAPRSPHSSRWTARVNGAAIEVEYQLRRSPAPRGLASLRHSGGEVNLAPGAARHLDLGVQTDGTPPVELWLEQFVGDVRVRVFDRSTLSQNQGPLEFWLPVWPDD